MRWSIAIYAVRKPEPQQSWYATTELYNDAWAAWHRRAKPGDLIAVQPAGHRWTPLERRRFLIIAINDTNMGRARMEVACNEPVWDDTSYPPYAPLDQAAWWSSVVDGNIERAARLAAMSADKRAAMYAEYLEVCRADAAYPQLYHAKRRHHIPIGGLAAMGVDTARMLDTDDDYVPGRTITRLDLWDKRTGAAVAATAGFNAIRPRSRGAMRTAAADDRINADARDRRLAL